MQLVVGAYNKEIDLHISYREWFRITKKYLIATFVNFIVVVVVLNPQNSFVDVFTVFGQQMGI